MWSFRGLSFFQAGRKREGSRSKISGSCSQRCCSHPHPWEIFYVWLINANPCCPRGAANVASQTSCSLTDTALAVCWASVTLGCYIALKWWMRKSWTQRIQTAPWQHLKAASDLDPIKKNYPVWLSNKTRLCIRLNEPVFLVETGIFWFDICSTIDALMLPLQRKLSHTRVRIQLYLSHPKIK